MKRIKWICLLLCIVFSFSMKAQSAEKTKIAIFEYVAAEYQASDELIIMQAKDSKGEIYFFHISKQDKIKNINLLYNEPADVNVTSRKISTKAELVGKKIQLSYVPIGVIDPASPYCCYRIIAVTPL